MSDQPKNLLDVLASIQCMEKRLSELETTPRVVEAGEFEIDEDPTLANGKGGRSFKKEITYKRSWSETPNVYTAITALNSDCKEKTRVEVVVDNKSNSGCTILVKTWDNSEIYHVKVSWFAILEGNL